MIFQGYMGRAFKMSINPSLFNKLNVTDSCSIWNILSSKIFLQATKASKCVFCCTAYVQYECLDKPRKKSSSKDIELKKLLVEEQKEGNFPVYHLDIDDLLNIEVLEKRMNLGKGELSSIAFAKQTRQAFLTDDQGARTLASTTLDEKNVQTTPHLFGWLIYEQFLTDLDKENIIIQHESFNRPLKKYFEIMYNKALEYRLMNK